MSPVFPYVWIFSILCDKIDYTWIFSILCDKIEPQARFVSKILWITTLIFDINPILLPCMLSFGQGVLNLCRDNEETEKLVGIVSKRF